MRVAELTLFVIRLPLRRQIKHASATRRASENLLVRCRLADGTQGWGEGVPRSYVTGETVASACAQMEATPLAEQFDRDCNDWADVFELCERFQPVLDFEDARGCGSNALRCAVELSVLDAFARAFGVPLSVVAEKYPPAQPVFWRRERVRYSGAITAERPGTELISATKMRIYGFAHCKVKVGLPGVNERKRLRRIRQVLGRRVDMRLDANEAWSAHDARRQIEPLMAFGVSCVEQPVRHEEVESLAELRRQLPVPIMLDESLTSQEDAERAIEQETCDLFNVRLSKCGGFLSSLRLAARAREAGLGYQLGCHPGESGILSAAGRHWAASVRDVRYLEGSYDRHLLEFLLTQEDITFGYGGWAPALSEPGLGVTIDRAALAKVAIKQVSFMLDGSPRQVS